MADQPLPEIVFDFSLPPVAPNPFSRWDDWFKAVGGEAEKGWKAVKETQPVERWESWATVLELNRLSALAKEKEEAVPPS